MISFFHVFFLYICLKDRVGRSERVLLRTHLKADISLNIEGSNTHDIPENSSFPLLFSDVIYHCVLQESV